VEQLNPEIRERLEKITDREWRILVLRLVNYACHLVAFCSWRTPSGILPKGNTAEDIAVSAIAKLLTGHRVWDPKRHPDLAKFLMDVVKSDVGGLVRSFENRRRAAASPLKDGTSDDPMDDFPHEGPSPDVVLLEQEQEEELRECIRKLAQGDARLEAVARGLVDGQSPGEIAEDLKVPVKRIYNDIRTLRRRLLEQRGK
jgi:DNA-directed RNA polymerase specialized sigma24 family protein